MKRIVLGLALAAAAAAGPLFSQEVFLGVKAGPNFTTLDSDDFEDVKSITRFIGGGFMVIAFSPAIGLQPELLFAQKGAKGTGPSAETKVNIDYIEVPILLRLQPAARESRFVPHLLAGPTIAFKTACKLSGESGGVKMEVDCEEDTLHVPVKDVDFGLAFGGGIDVSIGSAFMVIDTRYVLGLTQIDDSDDPSDAKNRAFGIMAGVRIPVGAATRSTMRSY